MIHKSYFLSSFQFQSTTVYQNPKYIQIYFGFCLLQRLLLHSKSQQWNLVPEADKSYHKTTYLNSGVEAGWTLKVPGRITCNTNKTDVCTHKLYLQALTELMNAFPITLEEPLLLHILACYCHLLIGAIVKSCRPFACVSSPACAHDKQKGNPLVERLHGAKWVSNSTGETLTYQTCCL